MSNASSQPAGFLASSRPDVAAVALDRGVPAGDRGRPRRSRGSASTGRYAELGGHGERGGRVGPVDPAGQLQLDQVPGRRAGRPRRRRRRVHCGSRAAQVQPVHHQSPPCALDRASRTRGRPRSRRASAGRRRPRSRGGRADGGPDHHRVVGVGDHVESGWPASGRRATAAAIIATSLARSSWSRLRLSSATTRGRGRVDHLGAGSARRPPARRTAWRPALASAEVCPVGMLAPKELVATSPSTPQRGGGQPGRGGLAVGAGDQRDLPAGGQVAQQVGVDLQADPAADDRAVAAPAARTARPRSSTRRSRPWPAGASSRPSRRRGYRTRCHAALPDGLSAADARQLPSRWPSFGRSGAASALVPCCDDRLARRELCVLIHP